MTASKPSIRTDCVVRKVTAPYTSRLRFHFGLITITARERSTNLQPRLDRNSECISVCPLVVGRLLIGIHDHILAFVCCVNEWVDSNKYCGGCTDFPYLFSYFPDQSSVMHGYFDHRLPKMHCCFVARQGCLGDPLFTCFESRESRLPARGEGR